MVFAVENDPDPILKISAVGMNPPLFCPPANKILALPARIVAVKPMECDDHYWTRSVIIVYVKEKNYLIFPTSS